MNKTVIDLFCGAGGLSEGFRQAGFHVLVGNDVDLAAGRTFEKTHQHATFIGTPIQQLSSGDLLSAAGLKAGELDVLVGGPPCQAYSIYNHQRSLEDERASLFREYLRMVDGLQPKWVVMENVTGIASIGNGALIQIIKSEFEKLGYRISNQVLKAEQYGVPKERRRMFFIGTRTDSEITFPEPTHGEGLQNFTTVWDAIGDLPQLRNGERLDSPTYQSEPTGWFQQLVRGNQSIVQNHEAPKLSKINLDRMYHIPQGGSWRDIPFHLLPAGMQRAKRSDHTKRYVRMKPEGLACTILTKCDVHWGAYIHPTQDRAISVREAARLQSFPDTFVFEGSRTEQYTQVGNAVPPLLGKSVAAALEGSANFAHPNVTFTRSKIVAA